MATSGGEGCRAKVALATTLDSKQRLSEFDTERLSTDDSRQPQDNELKVDDFLSLFCVFSSTGRCEQAFINMRDGTY